MFESALNSRVHQGSYGTPPFRGKLRTLLHAPNPLTYYFCGLLDRAKLEMFLVKKIFSNLKVLS